MITTETIVKRRSWTVYGSLAEGTFKGSGYCKDHFDKQDLVRRWRIGKLILRDKVLDSEDVPVWASAQKACCGYTEWESKFADVIDRMKRERKS